MLTRYIIPLIIKIDFCWSFKSVSIKLLITAIKQTNNQTIMTTTSFNSAMNRAMTTFTKDVALATITAMSDKYGFSIDEATRFVGIEEMTVPKAVSKSSIKVKVKSKRESDVVAPKDTDKPKRPPTAFFLFCADVRSKTDEKKTQSMLSESWNALSDEEKKPFEDKSKALKEEYHASKPVTKKGGRKKKGDQPEAVKATDPDLPAAPEGWSGPFEGTSLKYPKIDGKRFQESSCFSGKEYDEKICKAWGFHPKIP